MVDIDRRSYGLVLVEECILPLPLPPPVHLRRIGPTLGLVEGDAESETRGLRGTSCGEYVYKEEDDDDEDEADGNRGGGGRSLLPV